MGSKVTLQDVARRAGVHRSTVSLALRDHPRISPEVRLRLRALAARMGYRVNPLVAVLMRSRRTGRAVKHVTLAYVTNYPTRYGWRPPHHDRPDYFPGASARAQELGYRLEHFWLAEPGMTPQRLGSILAARNIPGLLLGRLPPGQNELRLPWEGFAAVALGLTLFRPALHRVTEDHFAAATLALDELQARGYRRIGCVFSDVDDSPRVGEHWLGAYLCRQARSGTGAPPPFFFTPGPDPAQAFAAWFRKARPDALLATHAAPVARWLEQAGRRAPRDVGLVALVNDHPEQGWSGVHCDPARLGSLAVDMLVGQLHRGESGLPPAPHEVLLRGIWCPGRTLAAAVPVKSVQQ